MEAGAEKHRNYVRERGFYADVLTCWVFTASQNVVVAARGKAQNKRPACALSAILCREDPSTRPNEVVAAQRVKFVV